MGVYVYQNGSRTYATVGSTHLRSAPHILFEFTSHDAFGYCTGDLLDVLF